MKPSALALAFAIGSCVLVPAGARAATHTDVGLLAAIVAGTHVGSENPIPVTGVVPGAVLEIVQHVDRFALHFEGIPTVAATAGTRGPFGRSSASLALVNATAVIDLDRRSRFRAGAGFQLVDLTNLNGNNGDRNSVRITSAIYTAGTSLPFSRGNVDLAINVDPNLRGILHVFNVLGIAQPDKPEAGAEIDYRAAYRWQRGDVTYRVGVRGLSYHTRNTVSGELVDRNVGAGVTFDVRFALGKS